MENTSNADPVEPRDDYISNLKVLYLASFIIVVGYSVILPFLPIYANNFLYELKISKYIVLGIGLQIGLIMAASKLVQFFLTPAYGDLSDEVGRKPLILVGMTIYTVLMIAYGFATNFVSLFILRALQGFGSASVWSNGEALVVDVSLEEDKGKNLGYYNFAMFAGLTLGPFLGYALFSIFNAIFRFSEDYSYRFTFVLVGVLGIISTLIIMFKLKDPASDDSDNIRQYYWRAVTAMAKKSIQSLSIIRDIFTDEEKYRDRRIYSLYSVALINGLGMALLLPIAALFLEEYYHQSPASIALIIGVIGALSIFGTIFGGFLSDRIGTKAVVVIMLIFGGLNMIILGIEYSITILVCLLTLRRFIFGIMQPAFRSLQSEITPDAVRGREFGIAKAFDNLGAVIGPILGGLLYDVYAPLNFYFGNIHYFGTGIVFSISGMLSILASIIIRIYVKDEILVGSSRNQMFKSIS